jgi:hypothetical protein
MLILCSYDWIRWGWQREYTTDNLIRTITKQSTDAYLNQRKHSLFSKFHHWTHCYFTAKRNHRSAAVRNSMEFTENDYYYCTNEEGNYIRGTVLLFVHINESSTHLYDQRHMNHQQLVHIVIFTIRIGDRIRAQPLMTLRLEMHCNWI